MANTDIKTRVSAAADGGNLPTLAGDRDIGARAGGRGAFGVHTRSHGRASRSLGGAGVDGVPERPGRRGRLGKAYWTRWSVTARARRTGTAADTKSCPKPGVTTPS